MLHNYEHRKFFNDMNQRGWERDITQYEKLKNMKANAKTEAFILHIEKFMKSIRDRYPNVKNW